MPKEIIMCETDSQSYGARNHLSDENILAVLDGTADQHIRAHLAHLSLIHI